jgi:hypothetical protein
MELSFLTFGYLFLRLAPFILVCFFTLSSIFNQDFKGFVYLIGLLFACFMSILVGRSFGNGSAKNEICKMITIGGSELTYLPISQCVFGYTFAYLLFTIIKYKMVKQNWTSIIFFTILIIADEVWNLMNSCYGALEINVALAIGASIGLLWAYIIDKSNAKVLQYYAGVNNNEICNRPSNQTFRCKVYKNGKLISNM